MLKYATFIVPMLLRLGNTSSSAKDVRGQIGVLALMSVALTFFLAAVFTWVAKTYSLDIAFLVIALILTAAAIVLTLKGRIAKASSLKETINRDAKIKGVLAAKADPLSEYIPDEILTHPVVQKALAQIEDKPFLSALVAIVLGMIVSNQLLDKTE
jgi:predicted ferric reductase